MTTSTTDTHEQIPLCGYDPSKHDSESTLWCRGRREMNEQLRTLLPTMASQLLYQLPWLISLHFAGAIGEQELAAAALSNTLCTVTGISISVGLSSALTTLTSQSRGTLMKRQDLSETHRSHQSIPESGETDSFLGGKQQLSYNATSDSHGSGSERPLRPLIYLYRGIFIQLLFVIPIGMWWISGMEPTLIALGQEPRLASMTAQYLRILAPGLWSYSVNWTLTAWLQCVEMADVPAFAAGVCLVLHIPFNIFFIYWLKLGYLGCAVATVVFQVIQPFLIIFYVFGTSHGASRVLESIAASTVGRTRLSFCNEARFAVLSIQGIYQYLSLAIPGVVMVSEWWAAEITTFLAGQLQPRPALALGAMSLYQCINSFCYMLPLACGVAGTTRVGYFLGLGNSNGAAFASKVCVLSTIFVSGVISFFLFETPHNLLPSLLTKEQDVIHETSRTISLMALYVVVDGVQAALTGIVRGCGRQCLTMPVVLIAYWVVGIPLSYYISFVRHRGLMCTDDFFCGDVGLVVGMFVGTCVHLLLLAAVVFNLDWKLEACRAKERTFV